MAFCMVHKTTTAQKYWLHTSALNACFAGTFACLFLASISTVSSQFLKHMSRSTRAMAAHKAMVLAHAAWSSPNNFTTGMVQVTAKIRPKGDRPILTMLSMSLSDEILVIMAERLLYGRLMAV